MYNDSFLSRKLDERVQNNSLRVLSVPEGLIDFCSNDYLGIATNRLAELLMKAHLRHGSGGARTLAGNYRLIEETEALLAAFHEAEAGLIFGSGYAANVGLMSAVPQRGDTILYDYLSHASLRDGIRLSFADAFTFRHNDLYDLEERLKKARGNVFVVTESLFSMDGDLAPLAAMTQLCTRYGAHLVVDEAHATGVFGEKGEGMVQSLQLQEKIFARVHTFGKAIGAHGAVVLGSARLTSYLLNFSRSFVFTTALPESVMAAIQAAYALLPGMKAARKHLRELIQLFQEADLPFEKLSSPSPIQAVIIPGNDAVRAVAAALQKKGFDVRPVLYPTVPKGKERLRVSMHAFNTKEELSQLIRAMQTIQQ